MHVSPMAAAPPGARAAPQRRARNSHAVAARGLQRVQRRRPHCGRAALVALASHAGSWALLPSAAAAASAEEGEAHAARSDSRPEPLAPPPVDLTRGLAGVDFTDDDIANHERLSSWLGEAYHSALRLEPELWSAVTAELGQLASAAAAGAPELAFAVGSALYSYFWWGAPDSGGLNVQAGEQAVDLIERSIAHTCGNNHLSLDDFVAKQCHIRWRQLMLVSAELARHLAIDANDVRRAALRLRETSRRFEQMRQLPYFKQFEALGSVLRCPHDVNYNMDYYPHVNVGPLWPRALVPIGTFLEEHFDDFRADLARIMEAETFRGLHRGAFVSETQFTPHDDDWQTVYFFLNQKFVPQNCEVAPRTCELLRSRRELAQCRTPSAGAGFVRLRPGARLKPHYGNGPRLSVHLGLRVPKAGDIHMKVGTATVRWEEGRSVVFDDTFIHTVKHDGDEPRFVLLLWFCHPCDSDNWDNPPDQQAEICRWPR